MTNSVKALGALRHMFHGDYRACVGLQFDSPAHAADALRTLGPAFKIGRRPDVAVALVDGDALIALKVRFKAWGLAITPCGYKHCRHQCRHAEIDNVNHSVDLGAAFTVSIPVVPAEQTEMFS